MATPIPFDYRKKVIQLHQSGESLESISQRFSLTLRSVQRICSRFEKEGEASFLTKYQQGGCPSPFDQSVRDKIAAVKDGDQGAPYIRSVMMERHPGLKVPHERTIQRYQKASGEGRPAGRPRQRPDWTGEPQHTWQIDGKGHVQLGSGKQISWMNIVDEATASDLQAWLFPPVHS